MTAALKALLTREAEATRRLHLALQAESEALQVRDVEALERTTAEKQALVGELERYAVERGQLLVASGLAADSTGFEQLVTGRGDADTQALWEQLRSELQACQELNLRNGQLLEGGRRFANDALSLLLGSERNGVELYDRGGSSVQERGRHTYAKV